MLNVTLKGITIIDEKTQVSECTYLRDKKGEFFLSRYIEYSGAPINPATNRP